MTRPTNRSPLLAGAAAPLPGRPLTRANVLFALVAGLATLPLAAEPTSEVTLKPVKVTAQPAPRASETPAPYEGGQVARGARLGTLGNVDLMDAPFNVTAYTEKTIADQQNATVAEVLRNDPSIRFTTPDNHNAENFTIRGFDLNSSELAFNGMYGMLPGAHVPTEFLERVEVFRGPSAMLSGMAPSSAVGGVINLVPKRAGDQPLTRVTARYAGDSRAGVAVDAGRRFGADKRFGIRFNGLTSSGETTLDDQKKRERFASVGMDYRGDRWKLELDAYISKQNQANGSPLMVGFSTLGRVLEASDSTLNALRGTYASQETKGGALRGEYEFSRDWSAFASIGTSRYTYDGYLNGTRVVVLNASGDARGQTYNQEGFTRGDSAEIGIRGRFSTGILSHQLTASASRLEIKQGLAPAVSSATYTTNIYHPIPNPTMAGAHGAAKDSADNTYSSYALSDSISALQERIILTLGARAQRVRQDMATPKAYDEQAITPMVGLVVKPWGPTVSIYANYMEGLTPGVTVSATYANEGEVLAPYRTRQAEAGLKWELKGFTNTFSVFRIEKPSTVEVDTGATEKTLALDGEQRNSGLEWNIFGQVASGVRVLGGAAYTQGRQIRASAVANNDKDAPGVPRWTANLGGEWDPSLVKGLTLNARLTYTGSQYLDAANKLEIPSWHRWDAGVRYATHFSGHSTVFRASVDNLTDRKYWSGRFNEGFATQGGPRTFKLSCSVDF